jgi:hypothetical protein
MLLHNYRARTVGINQIRTVFSADWAEEGPKATFSLTTPRATTVWLGFITLWKIPTSFDDRSLRLYQHSVHDRVTQHSRVQL